MEIEKAYFTLPEILARWSMPEADLAYLAENDRVRLSIRILNLPIEFGDYEETDDGRHFSIPWEQGYFNGLLDLHVRDVFQLFRIGEVSLCQFRTERAGYACFWGSREQLTIRKPDLVLRREERDRLEAETGFRGASGARRDDAFRASATTTISAATAKISGWGRSRHRSCASCTRRRNGATRGRAARRCWRRRDRAASKCPTSSSQSRTGSC